MTLLAFVPFYDPLPALYPGMSEQWLWLVLPLVIAISVVYKCTRINELKNLARDSAIMIGELIAVMALAAFVLAAGYWAYLHYVGTLVNG
ncbi:MAG TPA: hypothetical protein VHM90_06405 [Phycisphaerae bacterium]|nr:hypothetical protein [Phycisphaerae bacterium]